MDASVTAAPLRSSVVVVPSTTASRHDWLHQPQLHARLARAGASDEALLLLVEAAAAAGERPASRRALLALLLDLITRLDHQFNQQLNVILHHPQFRRLESGWRGLVYLVEQTATHDRDERVRVKVLALSWAELARDAQRAIEFDQTDLFRLIYSTEFDQPGGEPYGLLIGDYQIDHRRISGAISDIEVLKSVAQTAAAAFAPFITGAAPALLGIEHFAELAAVRDVAAQFDQPEYAGWRSLRALEDSRFIGITLPQIRLRQPWRNDGRRAEAIPFTECGQGNDDGSLWGNAAWALAAVAVRAYAASGWFAQIRGLRPGHYGRGLVVDLPAQPLISSGSWGPAAVDLQIGDRLEKLLADAGLVPLSTVPYSDHLVFFSNASVHQPPRYDSPGARVNARLSAMLQYTLCVSRFAHYVKVIARDLVGSFATAADCERELQRWLHGYTTASDSASDEVRARYPLHEASVSVREVQGRPGRYLSVIHLRPHFQLDQMVSTIRLVTELSPRHPTTA